MDSTIIAAIIGAVGTITSAFIAVVFQRQRNEAKKQLDKLEEAIIAAGKQDGGMLTQSAAYKIGRLEKVVEFDETGKGTQIQQFIDIRANQCFDNLQIPFMFSVEGATSHLDKPIVKELDNSVVPVDYTDLTILELKENKKELRGRFVLHGHFRPDSGPASFYWRQDFQGAFIMKRDEVLETYKKSDWKQEYSASVVIVPTDFLKIEVRFPENFKKLSPIPSPVAFVGGTHVVHEDETQRIAKTFQFAEGKANLAIQNPIVGIVYAVSWMPP